jgi:perosamine synthetase
MKSILIFGGTGFLGSNFVFFLRKKYKIFVNFNRKKIFFPNVTYVSIYNETTKDLSLIKERILELNPDIIINCLALSEIDKCERKIKLSKKLNYTFPSYLSKICSDYRIKFVQISTDHLFNKNNYFKNENFKKNTVNIYGKHKSKAEDNILFNNSKSLIIRTNFFGTSPNENYYLDKVLYDVKNNRNIYGVTNYYFTPIYVGLLIKYIILLLKKNSFGIFNIVGNDRVSKYVFYKKIIQSHKLNDSFIKKINLKSLELLAKRSNELSLSNKKLRKVLHIKIPNLSQQIKTYLNEKKKIKKFFYRRLPYGKHSINKSDKINIIKILNSGSLTQGSYISQVEDKIANYVGSKYAVLVSSATAGLHISYLSLGLSSKTKIITSPLTFVSTANAALFCNSTVKFSDINELDLNLDINQLKKNIRDTKIQIIVPVHFSGLPANMSQIYNIAKLNKIFVAEDAAHAFGAKYECGSMVGSCKYSDLCVFSFHPVKTLAAGEGGAVTTNSKYLYLELLKLRSHGIGQMILPFSDKKNSYTNNKRNLWYYEMKRLGFHYRQTELHAALLESQLARVDNFLSKRRNLAIKYDNFFHNINNVSITQRYGRHQSSNHLYILRFNFKNLNISRNELMIRLRKCGIYTQVHYIPVPMQPFYKNLGYNLTGLNNALKYYEECLSIPLYYDLSYQEQKYVQNTIVELIKQ